MTQESDYVPFSPPMLGEEEIAEVVDTLRSDWITTGPKTKQFERDFAEFVDAEGALALNSCTAGLHIALLASDIGPGDEVITSPMTFAATVNVIEHVGATPVLVDVEPDTLNIDPARIEQAITARTRAIMPVHFAGHPADMRPIREIATRHQLVVIEDAAHALPAAIDGEAIGSASDFAAFSFYATKNITTGEGGMLTGSPDALERARPYALHGISRDAWNRYGKGGAWAYDIVLPGFKYNMTDIQAALGIWQLRKLPAFHQRRQEIVARYNDAFENIGALQLPTLRANVAHAWHLYVLRMKPSEAIGRRDELIAELTDADIGSSVHFIPIHLHSYYKNKYGFQADDFPVAFDNYQRALSLPLSPRLTDAHIDRVISTVQAAMRQTRRTAA